MRLQGKSAVVTGGGSGIGRGICLKLAAEGASVLAADINLKAAEETAALVREAGGNAAAMKADVTSSSDTDAMVQAAVDAFGTVDILVNNAGTDVKGAVQEYPEETWDKLMDLNLKGVFLSTKSALKVMLEKKYGRIVNISSMAGKTGEAFTSPYCTTKFGVIGFTQSIALELAAQ